MKGRKTDLDEEQLALRRCARLLFRAEGFRVGRLMYGYLEKGIQTPMARGQFT